MLQQPLITERHNTLFRRIYVYTYLYSITPQTSTKKLLTWQTNHLHLLTTQCILKFAKKCTYFEKIINVGQVATGLVTGKHG